MWLRVKQSIFLNILFLIVAAFASYGAMRMVLRALAVKNESALIDAEIAKLKEEKARLEAAIAELKTPYAAEREAKERHNLKRPGEEVAVILSESADDKTTEEAKNTIWEALKKRIFR